MLDLRVHTITLRAADDLAGALKRAAYAIAAVLALGSWLAPNHYFPWPSFHGQVTAVGAMAILATIVLVQTRAKEQAWPWLAVLSLVVAVVPWLQYAAGLIGFSGDAWLVSGYLCGFALSLYIGRCIVRSAGLGAMLEIGSSLAISGSLLCMWLALYQWFWLTYLGPFALDLPAPLTRAHGNIGQPNWFALVLTLGTIACANLYERARIGGFTALLATGFFALGVVMSQSRAAILIWIAVAGWLMVASRRGALRRVSAAKVLLGLAVAAFAFLAWTPLLDFRLHVWGISDARALNGMTSTGMRPLHWATMIDAIGRSPWFGYGWNQVPAAQYLVAPDHPPTMELLGDSHNLILDLMVHNGAILGSVIIIAMTWWLARHLTGARNADRVMAASAVLTFALASMVEFPLNFTFFLLPVGLVMGGLSADAPWDKAVSLPRWVAPLLLIALSALTVVVTKEYLHAEEDLRTMRFEQQRIGKPVPRTFADDARVLTQLSAFFKFADKRHDRGNLSEDELAWQRKVVMRHPNWSLLSIYAGELARNGRPDDAAAVLTRICRTQKAEDCKLAQLRWEAWTKTDERIARIPFPPTP